VQNGAKWCKMVQNGATNVQNGAKRCKTVQNGAKTHSGKFITNKIISVRTLCKINNQIYPKHSTAHLYKSENIRP
jgi:hypothetical protein